MSAVQMQYANVLEQEKRQTEGWQPVISLSSAVFDLISPLREELIFDPREKKRRKMEMLSYCRTPGHMFMSNPFHLPTSAPPQPPGAEQEGRRAPQISRHNSGETKRQRGSQIKLAVLRGKRVRARYKSKQLRRQGGG